MECNFDNVFCLHYNGWNQNVFLKCKKMLPQKIRKILRNFRNFSVILLHTNDIQYNICVNFFKKYSVIMFGKCFYFSIGTNIIQMLFLGFNAAESVFGWNDFNNHAQLWTIVVHVPFV